MSQVPPKSPELDLCVERAAQGDLEAKYQLAWLHFNGYLTEQNHREAACLWHELAADAEASGGYGVAASYAYATCCAKGIGVGKDEEEALDWMRRTAKCGDARAQQQVGRMYMKGHGCDRDPAEAYYWLCMSVVVGLDDARRECEAVALSLDEADLERVHARGMRSLLSELGAWSSLNREVAAVRENYPVVFDLADGSKGAQPTVRVTVPMQAPVGRFSTIDEAEFIRQKVRLSQEEFAELVGVTRMTYHTWRRGSPIRSSNQFQLNEVVHGLSALVKAQEWPRIEEQLFKAKDKVTLLRHATHRLR